MSQYTDFYTSWLGNGNAFGGQAVRLKDQEPLVFNPLDISGCAMWFDANDNDAVVTNEFNTVLSWKNKGIVGGQFDLSGSADITYGSDTVNGLNTVTFTPQSFMQGVFQLNFQARSIFVVTKQLTVDLSNANPWLTCDTNGGMETFAIYDTTTTYFIGKHPSPVPELAFDTSTDYVGTPVMAEFINAGDLSGNWFGLNGTQYPAVYEAIASGYNTNSITYYLGQYFGGVTSNSSQTMCEVIVYNTALNDLDRLQVEQYLRVKWNIQEPSPPVPPPFVPTDISGLYIWMDANNTSSLSLDLANNVLSWSNLGLAKNVFSSNTGTATVAQDGLANNNYVMVFPAGGTDLATTMTLPYLDRTQFVVFNNIADLSGQSYPYTSFIQSYVNSEMQTGASYDAGSSAYFITMCQQGQNCPVVGKASNLNTCNYSIAIMQNNSKDYTKNLAYFNGGSNVNIGTDLGNLFLQDSEPYYINNANSNAPANVICEILEYDSCLPSSNISTVANYLVNKWAISSFTTIS